MNKKLNIKIKKDLKKDNRRKSKEFGVTISYPRFKAEGNFLDKKLEFSEDHFSSRLSVKFKESIKIPKNRREYGEDFVSSDGSLILLRFKLNNKGQKIITEFECFGGSSDASRGKNDGK